MESDQAVPEFVTPLDAGVRGRRLVGDDQLPAWMRQLVANVDRAQLPGPIHNLTAPAPATARRGSVLMLFGEGPAGPDLLLTERAATMRSHAGQPAFPGGANDPGEDAITAALREGAEETGLLPESVLPVALFPELYLPPSGFLVRPVLAYWHTPGQVAAIDPAETAVVARVPVAELIDPANRGRTYHPSGYVGPAFQVADLLVWGFTAGLVDVLLDLGGWMVPWDQDRMFELPV
jgi:8-oxo-dGTP pyrophosphatase MutT (NUDIX family)